jgi:uroporphyrinogen III methyltransferase/synthase
MIQIICRPYADFQPQEQTLFMKPGHDWIVFTSQHTVQHWFTLLEHSGQDTRALAGTRIASIGTVTTRALEGHGIRPDLQASGDREHSQGLAEALAKLAPRGSILLPRSSAGLRILPDLLTQAGYTVTELVLYHTRQRSDDPGLDLEDYDIIEFSSPSTVEAFRVWHPSIPERILVHTRGPQTATCFAECYPAHPEAAQGIRP